MKTLRQQLYETGREVRDEKACYEALAQKTADDAQELHDLRELVFHQQTEHCDEAERPSNMGSILTLVLILAVGGGVQLTTS